jgi:hypothetical protein
LRIDAQRLVGNMPVNHHARLVIGLVPLRQQVLVPGGELFRVRGAPSGCFSPNGWLADGKGGIDNPADGLAQRIFGHKTMANILEISVTDAMITHAHTGQAGVSPQTIEAEQ